MRIRLVTFDLLHTLITPRQPIHVQYADVLEPYLGKLDPRSLKRSFKISLKQLQTEEPVYRNLKGTDAWWGEVIRRTAVGAGADPTAVRASLGEIVPRLLQRFSSKEGYALFDDVLPTLQLLSEMHIRTAVISNADSRVRSVLQDLSVPATLMPIILSEEEGIEKPASEIFLRTLQRVNTAEHSSPIRPSECLHIGDELECDYFGAVRAGMNGLLLRRPDPEGQSTDGEDGEDLVHMDIIKSLRDLDLTEVSLVR